MRIEILSFSNINSLAGEFVIDFTHPGLSQPGIFVITGPTGSGKTSIMDAICFALYGESPRQKGEGRQTSFSKSRNEMLSRGAWSCYAAVQFEHGGKHYKAYSEHSRAKGAAAFAVPVYRFSEVLEDGTERQLATQGKARDMVVEITGLSYENFTRCMMLAQGDFAAFLKSDIKERSAVLSTITGTEIYLQIGEKVHEKLQAARAEVAQFPQVEVLSPEERQRCEVGLKVAEEEQKQTLASIALLREKLAWLDECQKAQSNLEKAQHELAEAQAAYQHFVQSGDDATLQLAIRANKVNPSYALLQSQRQQGIELAKKSPRIQETLQAAQDKYQQFLLVHQDAAKQSADGVPVLQSQVKKIADEMRPQEAQLAILRHDVAEKKKRVKEVQKDVKEYQSSYLQLVKSKNEEEANRKQLQKSLNELSENVPSAESLALMQGRLSDWEKSPSATQELPDSETLGQSIEENTRLLDACLQGRTPEELSALCASWEKLADVAQRYHKAAARSRACRQEEEKATLFMQQLPDLGQAEQSAMLAKERAEHLQRLLSIEDKLSELYEDFCQGKLQSCPCCGAPTPGIRHVTRNSEYQEAQQLADAAFSLYQALSKQHTQAEQVLLAARTKREEALKVLSEVEVALLSALRACDLDSLPPDVEELLQSWQQLLKEMKRLQGEKTCLQQAQESVLCREKLWELLLSYVEQKPQSLDAAQNELCLLKKRRQDVDDLQLSLSKCEQSLQSFNQSIQHIEEQQQKVANLLSAALQQEQSSQSSLSEKLLAFVAAWGKNVTADALKESCRQQIEDLKNAEDAAAKDLSQAELSLAKAKTAYAYHVDALNDWKNNHQQALQSLNAALSECSFASESQYLLAAKAIPQMETLQKRKEFLQRDLGNKQTLLNDKKTTRDAVVAQAKAEAEETPELLQEQLSKWQVVVDQKTDLVTEWRAQLLDDDKKIQQREASSHKLAVAQQNVKHWEMLHHTLGGSKESFLRYAQQITFDALIRHANVELRQLHPRYILKRNTKEADGLGLDVIDLELDAESPRSCSNLSGGESFIVSLALALGLSRTTSAARIDSLFLDEGFGTLDNDTLEHVLNCLESMQASGKMVGIISHVDALSERISSRIKVERFADAFSTLTDNPALTAYPKLPDGKPQRKKRQ